MSTTSHEDRRQRRRLLDGAGAAALDGALLFECRITNISEAGACLKTGDRPAPDRFQLIDIDAGQTFSVRVVWRRERSVGVAFLHTRAIDGADTPEWLTTLWRELKTQRHAAGQSAAA